MSNITQYDNQAIIIITEDCSATVERLHTHMIIAMEMGEYVGKPYVVILDVSQCSETYHEVMDALDNIGLKLCATAMPDYILLVGSPAMLETFRNRNRRPRYGNQLIPIFLDFGHALQMAQNLLRLHR